MAKKQNVEWLNAARRVLAANTEDFVELVRVTGLDPKRHLRFADWSGVDFRGADLRGFDFRGARLVGCDFEGALIEGACFDQAEIDQAGFDPRNRTNLRRAKDWPTYVKTWSRSKSLPRDAHLPVSAVFQDAPFAPEMVVVPNGYFTMGSPEDEPGREPHEEQQRYFVEHSFAVGRFAVTFEEWDTFIADGGRDKFAHADGSRGRWRNSDQGRGKWDDRGTGRGNMPAVDMSWHDAKAYVAWLSDKTGKTYRLLHDVEWEYVARAGTTTTYWWGNAITPDHANYDPKDGSDDIQPAPVDRYAPNPWGLYQVLGNVFEWCEGRPFTKEEDAKYTEMEKGGVFSIDRNLMVAPMRGGGFPAEANHLRSAAGQLQLAPQTGGALGLRVARNLT